VDDGRPRHQNVTGYLFFKAVEILDCMQKNTLIVATGLSPFRNLPVTGLLPGLHCPGDGGMVFQNP
jgi:hypothetical protein